MPIKPKPLPDGGCIGIVAPASNVKRELVEQGSEALKKLGYRVKLGAAVFETAPQYFAGDTESRLRDIHAMFSDPEVDAVLCARGGYGSNYLLPGLDLDLIRRNPKPFIGYSDNTSLLTWITDQTGMNTFHGPMLAADFVRPDGVELESWRQALAAPAAWGVPAARSGAKVLRPGKATGRLYGGCLSLLVESLGTSYEIRTGDSILFLEDVTAKPYQIDRMLMHLKFAGKLERVRGIVFGEMLDCVQPNGMPYTLEEVVLRVLADFAGPIAYGFRSGHVSRNNVTLAIGAEAELEAGESAMLRFIGPTVGA